MLRPPLIILAGAAVLAAAVTLWPGAERDMVAEGLLPASSGPRIAAAGVEEASSAARMIRFAGAGAPMATAGEGAPAVESPIARPRPDLQPVLVGVLGKDGALTGYFSSNGVSLRARRGDSIDGWRLAALERRSARLTRGRKVLNLSLFSARSGPLSAAMPAAVRPVLAETAPPAAAASPPAGSPQSQSYAAPPSGPASARPPARIPPPPKGSQGYWVGPPGSMPPGYVPFPGT
jgi:hypothetical protein